MATMAPTEIKARIDANLAKLRAIHDDPSSNISDTTRARLQQALYGQNMLQRPTTPVKAEHIFPLTGELMKAAEDVSHGKRAQWDPQHPVLSAGGVARDVAGQAFPFLAPVTGALDAMALPARAIGRPAVESAMGLDPQLSFMEKAKRSLTTDRDVGNVIARRTAADAPQIVERYMAQGMPEAEAARRMQGDVTRNWMIGGTAENVMNLMDPTMVIGLPRLLKAYRASKAAIQAQRAAEAKAVIEALPQQAPLDEGIQTVVPEAQPSPAYQDPLVVGPEGGFPFAQPENLAPRPVPQPVQEFPWGANADVLNPQYQLKAQPNLLQESASASIKENVLDRIAREQKAAQARVAALVKKQDAEAAAKRMKNVKPADIIAAEEKELAKLGAKPFASVPSAGVAEALPELGAPPIVQPKGDMIGQIIKENVLTPSEDPRHYSNFSPEVSAMAEEVARLADAADEVGQKARAQALRNTLDRVVDDGGVVHPNLTPQQAVEILQPAITQTKAAAKRLRQRGSATLPDVSPDDLKAALNVAKVGLAKEAAPEGVPVITKAGRGQYQGKVNLSTIQKPEVAAKVMDMVDAHPNIAKGVKVADRDVDRMARDIIEGNRTETLLKDIQESAPGQLRAEVRAQNMKLASQLEGFLATDFGKDVTGLKAAVDKALSQKVAAKTKGSSEIGGALREYGLPMEAQKRIAKQFQDLMEKYKDSPDVIKRLKELKGITLDPKFNPSVADKLYYIWINGLLSGPKTQITNTMGNTAHLLMKFPDRALESVLDMGAGMITGKRSTTMDELGRMGKALVSKNRLPEEYRYKGGLKAFDEDEFISPLQDKFTKKLEPLMYGTKILGKTDEFFGNKVAQMEYEALKGKGYTDLELRDLLKTEAEYRTFTRLPSRVTNVLLYAKQRLPGFRWIAPFIRTAADIIGQAGEHTPLGAYGIVKSRLKGTLTQRELVQRAARITKGTLFGIWAYDQWKKGRLTGGAPREKKAREHFLEVQHKAENAIRIGSKWVPLANIEPYGSIISTFVNFYEGANTNYKDSQSAANAFMAGVMKAGMALGNKRYLSGVSTVINALADPEKNAPKVLGQIGGGFIGGNVKMVTDQTDTTVRKATTVPEMIQRRVPGFSKKLPPQRNVFGADIKKPSGLNLFNIKDATLTPEEQVIWNTPMGKPESTISGQKLTDVEYAKLQAQAGAYKKQMIKRYANRLRNMSAERKKYMVDAISSAANQRAVGELQRSSEKFRPKKPF